MNWFENLLFDPDSIAHIVLLYSVVIAAGIFLGKIKVFGISFGSYLCAVCRHCGRAFRFYGKSFHS